ncbi:MAG: hypothetical protein AB8I08_13935 [Sandaracinaceae bacterium]
MQRQTVLKGIAGFGCAGITIVLFLVGALVIWLTRPEVGDDCSSRRCDRSAGQTCMGDAVGRFCTVPCETSADCAETWSCDSSTVTRNGHEVGGGRYCMRPEPGRESLLSGEGQVTSLSGSVRGVEVGTGCTYRQNASPDMGELDSRWEVSCGGVVLYGAGQSGYNPRSNPAWTPGMLANDASTSSVDGDPALLVQGGRIVIRDDEEGTNGAVEVEIAMD